MRSHSFSSSLNDESDSFDARRGRRRRFDDEVDPPVRRGRLTDHERALLASARVEEMDALSVPSGADRWSTWGQGEMGPEPLPDWVITAESAVDTVLGVVKTGKEAEVFLVERSLPHERAVLMAEKRYRSADHRLFHRDAGYLEGRQMKESRMSRAVANRTSYGRKLIAEQWAAAEFTALSRLWLAGAPVPYPIQRVGTDLLLEFIGDEDGGAAPRLAQLRPDEDELADLWMQLRAGLGALAQAGYTHGDLSAYNVLVHQGQLVLIDLPQVVDVVVNPRGRELMERDVRNIGGWFAARGLANADGELRELAQYLAREAGLSKYGGV